MRTNVTFVTDIPVTETEPPFGEAVARRVAEALRAHDPSMRVVDSYEDYAWWLEGSGPRPRPWLMLGFVDDGPHQWLALIHSGRRLRDRIRGRTDDDAVAALALALHDALSESVGARDVRWHEGEFGDGWSPRPD